MFQSLSKLGVAAALCGLLLVPGFASAQGRARTVTDDAKMFSPEAIKRANETIKTIHDKHKKDLMIETVEKAVPKDERTKWAENRFNSLGVDGVYVVISKSPDGNFYRFVVGNKTRTNGYFDTDDTNKLGEIIKAKLKGNPDETLREITNYTLERMNKHAAEKTPKKKAKAQEEVQAPAPAPVVHGDNPRTGAAPWVGWVCMIVGILLVVWVVFALIRALTGGMGGGGYGYGPGYGGGYGGGGGFFTGLLGGMFGAMAGMWIYNHMFGGHSTYSDWGMSQPAGYSPTGDAVSSSEPYEADTDAGGGGGGDDAGGGDAGGGDWGGGGGGDDAGGGGGDWGGGGDAGGGGGDWGGGGDAGGGGGDWGGGGGGGGGDFGGGGGGDW